MIKFGAKLLLPLILLLHLTACWNASDIQNMAYATAIGLDYSKGKYIAYVQVLNFTNIAKTESVEIGKPLKNWTGRGEGHTVTEALQEIKQTSQLRMFWSHVKTVVVSESLMKNGLVPVYDAINRAREVRYTVTVFGTHEDIPTLFAQKSLLNFSPLDSLLSMLKTSYRQNSFITPLQGFKLIASFNEPKNTTLVPVMSLNSTAWKEDLSPKLMFSIDGAYAFFGTQYVSRFSLQELEGIRWVNGRTKVSSIHVPLDHPTTTMNLRRLKMTITPVIHPKDVRFHMRLKLAADVIELRESKSETELSKEAEQLIRKEIQDTYLTGINHKLDLYQLGERLYRRHPKVWKREFDEKPFSLLPNSLDQIEVIVEIRKTGKYKDRI